MVNFFLEGERVPEFVTHLMGQRAVYAPHPKGRASFSFEKVDDAEAVVLDYPRTMHSVKKFFLPPHEELLAFDLEKNTCESPDLPTDEPIFFGVHSYDMAAVGRLDYNFTVGHPEKNYLARREGAVFVGVSFEPDEFHFAGSVGIRPEENSGCDIFLTKCLDGYVVEVLTRTGQDLVEGFDMPAHDAGRPATGNYQQHIYLPQAKLGEVMDKSYDNPVWMETAEKCVGCGTCNIVCPTCYCFNVEEEVDITLKHGSRARTWDSCMLRGFSEVAGGEVFRETLAARQRHRVFRKFKYISDETGQPWCVGCGRCTAYCTAGISIVNIVNRLIGDTERVGAPA